MESDIFFDEKKSKAIFENFKAGEKIIFVFEIDRNTKPRETKGIAIKLKTASSEIDMKEAIVSQESFTKPTSAACPTASRRTVSRRSERRPLTMSSWSSQVTRSSSSPT